MGQNNKMKSVIKVVYGYDTLCGWCYGFIPAVRLLTERYPSLLIKVVAGGLFTGPGARPYATLVEHIRSKEGHLEQVTGYRPSDAFHEMITSSDEVIADSAIPTHAIIQMESLAPERVLEFAHLLQEAHFGDGKDLNKPEVYDDICKQHALPFLNTQEILQATATDPKVATHFQKAIDIGIRSYPSIILQDSEERFSITMDSIYDPEGFVAEFERQAKKLEQMIA